MRWIVAALFTLISGAAAAAEPFARVSIEEQGQAVPGQQIHVLVDVFAPDFFTSPPQFPLFDLPDALVTIPNERSQNMIRTIDGVEYAGIRRTYSVVPVKPGTFTLPPITIDLGYSVDGKPTKGVAVTPGLSFDVSAGAEGVGGIAFAAKGLTLDQSFDREPSSLKKGDALVRTIVVFAEDTQAMLIPALAIGAADSLKQYVKPPKIADDVQVDRVHGSSRTETIVYTADTPGSFSIPAVEYPWFDVDAGSLQKASLPAIKVTVSAVTEATDQQEAEVTNRCSLLPAFVLIGFALLVAAIWVFRKTIGHLLTKPLEWFRMRRTSRRARLRRLRTIIRVGKDAAIYSALQEWSRSLGHRSLTEWLETERSPRLQAQVEILQRRLFRSRDMQLDRGAFADLVGKGPKKAASVSKSKLPDLNPA